ncbi:MAG: GMC oxidoreductase [Burkholderiales bacterium]|nr:GMC oxidoreductase [Burkholderiales bacterium]
MKTVVVGGGVAASHAALTLLERGLAVEMWDVGREEPEIPLPGVDFHALKGALDDPVNYFLGTDLQALIPPGADELLRYPPARRFLLEPDDPLWPLAEGTFRPRLSLARGGLANGWGANALAFDADDLRGWPIGAADLAPDYATVRSRLPIAGPPADDLSPWLGTLVPNEPPVPLTATDRWLLARYARVRAGLNRRGVYLGHARMAVRTTQGAANSCDQCDRCLWGCPRQAIYNPARDTLAACARHPGFTYRPGRLVLRLIARDGRIVAIRYLDTRTGAMREEACDAVFLAAGAIGSGVIFLNTLAHAGLDLTAESAGLMDTQAVKIPYLALGMLGRPPPQRAFQFNRLNLGLLALEPHPPWPRYLHGEVLHLTGLLYHPLIAQLPLPAALASRLFHALRSALGVVTLFFPDRIRPGNRLVLTAAEPLARVRAQYSADGDQQALWARSVRRVQRALLRLGCLPRAPVYAPPGGGIHYAGTIPMGSGPRCCDAQGRSHLFRNLFIADGAAFPTLPSKSITLNLAAHATRVARLAPLT